jgi:membrane associated rhomboid family serine protease
MLYGQTPKWIERIERLMPGLGIPNLALYLTGAQAIGFFFVLSQGARALDLLTLYPSLVLKGELWRLVTFLAVPLSLSPLWMVFALWFLYFIVNGIEQEWGEFRTTLYVLVAVLLANVFSFTFRIPIGGAVELQSTLFLAAATIAPEHQILLLVVPVKMKWLAWVSVAFIVWEFIFGKWFGRLYLLVMYANYLLFFGPYFAGRLRAFYRRRRFQRDVAAGRADESESTE